MLDSSLLVEQVKPLKLGNQSEMDILHVNRQDYLASKTKTNHTVTKRLHDPLTGTVNDCRNIQIKIKS